MAKLAIKKGSADVTVYLFAQDSSKTTGVGLTGLAYNTASLTAYYVRPLGSATQISLASLAGVDSAHTDGGFKEIDATNMPGVYRLDLPDAVCASGAPSAVVMLKGAANLAPVLLELQLLTNDPNDIATETTAAAVKAKTDNLPASPAAVGSAMTLTSAYDKAKDDVLTPLAAAKSVVDAVKAKTDNLPASPAAVGSLMGLADGAITTTKFASGAINAAAIASNAITDAKIATDAFSAAKFKADAITKIQNGLATPTNITGGTITTVTNLTNLPNAPADWLTASAVKSDAVTKIQNGLAAASDLSTANSNISSIKSKTDNLPATPANEATLTAIKGAGWTNETLKKLADDIANISAGSGASPEQIWTYITRTLTTPATGAVLPAAGAPLEIYKDSTIVVNLTGLGNVSGLTDSTSGKEDKVWFTAKRSLDEADASSIIQVCTLYPGAASPSSSLLYINGAPPAAANHGSFLFTDKVTGAATLTLKAVAADDLPIYSVSPLYWDVKSLDYSTGVVNILAQGEMYIYGTPTRSIA